MDGSIPDPQRRCASIPNGRERLASALHYSAKRNEAPAARSLSGDHYLGCVGTLLGAVILYAALIKMNEHGVIAGASYPDQR